MRARSGPGKDNQPMLLYRLVILGGPSRHVTCLVAQAPKNRYMSGNHVAKVRPRDNWAKSKLQVGVCSDLVVFDQLPLRKLMAKQEKQESIVVVMA